METLGTSPAQGEDVRGLVPGTQREGRGLHGA